MFLSYVFIPFVCVFLLDFLSERIRCACSDKTQFVCLIVCLILIMGGCVDSLQFRIRVNRTTKSIEIASFFLLNADYTQNMNLVTIVKLAFSLNNNVLTSFSFHWLFVIKLLLSARKPLCNRMNWKSDSFILLWIDTSHVVGKSP